MRKRSAADLSVRPVGVSRRTFGLSWPLLIALFVLAWILYDERINRWLLADADTYWHLAAGRWILEHGSVPNADPFSHSMARAPWTAHEWLAEVVLALVHQAAGWGGLVFLVAALFAGTLAYVLRFLLARMEPVPALMFVMVAASMMLSHLGARPHVLMWPLLAVWVGSLTHAGEHGDGPPWLLLPLMTVWANLHGSFVLGLALAGALAFDAVMRSPSATRRALALRWAGFVALAVLSSVLTPWGPRGLLFPFELASMSVANSLISEWRSPDFQRFHPLELWLLVVLALACVGGVRLPWVRLVLVLGLVHLALRHHRHASLLGLLSPFLMAAPLGAQLRALAGRREGVESLDRLFAALAAPAKPAALGFVVFLGVLMGGEAVSSGRFAPAVSRTPEAALRAAFAAGVSGPVFNSYNFGGYLIYSGVPVFIDGRADMYGDPLIQRYVEAVNVATSESLPKLLADYRIGWTLFEPGTPALALLDRLPGWRRVHADEVAVVHMKDAGTP